MNNIQIISATIADYPIIQNLARFYVYDRSGFMGWGCESNGMFECIDFKHYFENPNEKAFLIKVADEIAGFVLIDKEYLGMLDDEADEKWNMGEFFIIAKFQGRGISDFIAKEILKKYLGSWSIAVMIENTKALNFWHRIVKEISKDKYFKTFKSAEELENKIDSQAYAMDIFNFKIF